MPKRAIQADVQDISKEASGQVHDPGFEVGIEAMRWFYYKHRYRDGRTPFIQSVEHLRRYFRDTHVWIYGRRMLESDYETKILEKEIRDFIEAHKDLVAEMEILR